MPAPRGLVQQIDQSLHRTHLLPRGARLLVAVSGGADSVALLRILAAINGSDYWQWTLVVGHVDHGMRGRVSAGDARFVRQLAAALKLKCLVKKLKLPAKASEDAARRGRFAALAGLARRARCEAAVLAQHADDQAETVLMRIFRGTGIDGLAAMRSVANAGEGPAALRVLRPLLHVRRAGLLAYLESVGQGWREDATNATPRYLRNRVRAELLPRIKVDWPQAIPALCRLAALAHEAQVVIAAASGQLLATCRRESPYAVTFSRKRLREAPAAVASDALRRVIEGIGGSVESADFERLREALFLIFGNAGGKQIDMGRGVVISLRGDRVEVARRKPAKNRRGAR